jgi:hypothetical protein
MADPVKPGEGEIDATPGLAGGPGPTPPGVDDGTAAPRRAEPERMAPPPSAREQQDEGEAAERIAAVRRPDVPALARDREGRGAEEPEDEAEARTRR